MTDVVEEPQRRSQLPLALGIAIGIAVVMTVLSVSIYYFAGFYKLDLSRPGFEAQRADIDNTVEATFDTTGPLTTEVLAEVLKDFDTRVNNLNTYSDFNDQVLRDEDLLLAE